MQCYKCRKALPARATVCPACKQAVYTTAGSPGAGQGRRLDGCLPETTSPQAYTAVPNVSSLPPRVDLRAGCSPVENQGQVGSCCANAIIGAVEFKRRKQGKQDDLSRLFLYFNARRLGGGENEDCGARIAHGMAAFLAHGAPPESAWPYDPSKVTKMPDDAAYAQAGDNSDVEYARVDGLEHIKGALFTQHPVVFSISLPTRCYDEAAAGGVMPTPTDAELADVQSVHGRHAMLLVGYDTDKNIFHIRNSWGTEWGDQGYCRLSIDTFARAMTSHTAWILGSLDASGAFSVTRPAVSAPAPVEGSVRDQGAKFRDQIRSGLSSDMDSALKKIRDRVNPRRDQ